MNLDKWIRRNLIISTIWGAVYLIAMLIILLVTKTKKEVK